MRGWDTVRIALLSDCYLPRLGGIEVQVHDLAHSLQAAGHEVEVLTATVGPQGQARGARHVEDGVVVHRHAFALPVGPALPIPVNPFAVGAVRDVLAHGGFDVAHAHMGVVSPFAVDAAGLALDVGLPTAITWHCVVDGSAPVHRLLGYAARWARAGAALSAVSGMAAARVAGIAGSARVDVLPNGIDTSRWQRPDRASVNPGVLRIVGAQRMAPRKRPWALLDVLRVARERTPEHIRLEAVIVGDGTVRGILQRRIAAEGLDWVSLPGRVTRDELRHLHWSSDLYLSAARLEAFGIAALEARTAGLPVVALAGTGADDFIEHGVNGLLAAEDADLGAQVARLAADAELRGRIAEHNRLVPPPMNWPEVVEQPLAQYTRAGA